MIETMQAHWTSVLIIVFSLIMTPFYWFFVLETPKAKMMAWLTAVIGAIMLTINLFNVPGNLGPAGGALIGIMWILPSFLVWKYQDWFTEINQKSLVGLQIFRLIGALFILEMFRGHIPGSFAWPAGLGDIFVGSFALFLF